MHEVSIFYTRSLVILTLARESQRIYNYGKLNSLVGYLSNNQVNWIMKSNFFAHSAYWKEQKGDENPQQF